MRHHVAGKKLNRSRNHRQALFKNLVKALIHHGHIVTTPAKAKAVQGLIDSLMTSAKKGSVIARRQIDRVLNQTQLVNKLVDEIAPVTKRASGYTRLIKLAPRTGDDAPQVRLEWVDAPVVKETLKTPAKPKAVPKKKAPAKKPALPTPALAVTKEQPQPKASASTLRTGMIRQKSGER